MELRYPVNERLDSSFRVIVGELARQRTPVPVKELAARVVAESGCDPALFEDILDAICLLSIQRGLTIEFTRPMSDAA
ncbi:MAG TPA: hypothetical protein VHB74_14425 [Devosia sp.]|nr:hypothetical protein [Devosia sp.]